MGLGKVGIVILLIGFCALSANAQVVLSDTQVYIDSQSPLNEDMVLIPISFTQGALFPSFPNGQAQPALPTVQIGSLPTQVVVTSYYKDGSARTATARVIVSKGSGEQIYTINNTGNDYSTFTPTSQVSNLLNGTNGNILKAVVYDLYGHAYSKTFNLTEAKVLEDGPVAKVYEFTRKLRPVPGTGLTTPAALPYMFTAKIWVTVVKNKDVVKIDSQIINFGNLEEDVKTTTLLNTAMGTYYKYQEGQTGLVFYDRMYIEMSAGTNATLTILDYGNGVVGENYLHPSRLCVNASDAGCSGVTSSLKRFLIMPTDGQQILSGINQGPYLSVIPNQSNYLAAGQSPGITKMSLYINQSPPSSSDPNYDYFENNGVNTGQSLSRWKQVNGYLFPDLFSYKDLTPNFNFATDALTHIAQIKAYIKYMIQISGLAAGTPHRFSNYFYNSKDLGTGGMYPTYLQDSHGWVKYLLSCASRCQSNYLQGYRLHLYGSSNVAGYAVGFKPWEHPETSLSSYRESMFEVETISGFTVCQKAPSSQLDTLGFCMGNLFDSSGNPVDIAPYRVDAAHGNIPSTTYFASGNHPYYFSQAGHHGWSGRDGAHLAMGAEFGYYYVNMDYPALFMARSQIDTAISPFIFGQNHNNSYQSATRDRGRVLINASKLFTITRETGYKDAVKYLIYLVDIKRNKDAPGSHGKNPLTGDDLPVKYFADGPESCHGCSGADNFSYDTTKTVSRLMPFQHAQILHGLAQAYMEVLTTGDQFPSNFPGGYANTSIASLVSSQIADGLFFMFNYAYKSPSKVINDKDSGFTAIAYTYINNQVVPVQPEPFPIIVNESMGGFATFNNVIMAANPVVPGVYSGNFMADYKPPSEIRSYTAYGYNYVGPQFPYTNLNDNSGGIYLNGGGFDITWETQIYQGVCAAIKVNGIEYVNEFKETVRKGVVNNFTQTSSDARGVDFAHMKDSIICPLGYALGFSSLSSGSCTDNDGDGYTNCAGDTMNAPGQANQNPGILEYASLCLNGIDDNLNGLADCNDPQCLTGGVSCNTAANYCGDGKITSGETCDVTFLNIQLANNGCPTSQCYVGHVPLSPVCTCATTSTNPFISSISPNPIITGQSSYSMTIVGTNIGNGATVNVGSLPAKSTTYNSSTSSLAFALSSAEVSALGTPPVTVNVTVTYNSITSNPSSLSITAPSVPPVLTGFNPLFANQQVNTLLTISGSNFQSGATIKIGPSSNPNLVTLNTSGSGNSLSTTLDSANANALPVSAALHIKVQNPDGLTSNVLTNFEVKAAKPSLQAITYPPITAGQASGLIRLNGDFFQSGAVVIVDQGTAKQKTYSTSGIPPTLLTFTIPSADTSFLGAGTHNVRVQNLDGQSSSNTLNFSIDAEPDPVIDFIVPTSQEKDIGFTLTVNGSNFKPDSDILFSGNPIISTITVNPTGTQMSVPIAGSDTVGIPNGTYPIQVLNPSGALSNPASITLSDPAPVLSTLSPPGPFTIGSSNIGPLTLTGLHYYTYGGLVFTNTTSGSSIQLFSEPQFQSGTSLQFTLTPSQAQTLGPGTISLAMKKGSTGILSNALTFTLNSTPASPPTLSDLTPLSVVKDGASKVFTLTGSNFKSNSLVKLDGTTLSSGVDLSQIPTTITVTLSSAQVSGLSTTVPHSFLVENPGTPALQSNALNFTASNSTPPAPVLSSVNPISASKDVDTLLTLSGTNLGSVAQVFIDATQITPFNIDATNPNLPKITFTLTSAVATSISGSNPHLITVKDSFNQTSNGIPLDLTLDTTTPPLVVSLTSPSEGSSFASNITVPFSATYSGGNGTDSIVGQILLKKDSSPAPTDILYETPLSAGGGTLTYSHVPSPTFDAGTYYWQVQLTQGDTVSLSAVQTYIISAEVADVPENPTPTPPNNNGPTGGNSNPNSSGGGSGKVDSLVTPEETVPDYSEIVPTTETCDGVDNDQDGTVDEGCSINLSVPVNTSGAFYFLLFLFNGIVSVLASMLQLVAQ